MGNLQVSVVRFIESLSEEQRLILNAFMAIHEEGDQVPAVEELRRKHDGSVFSDVANLVETQRQRLKVDYDTFRFLVRVLSGDERGVRLIADMILPGGVFEEENPFDPGMRQSGWAFHKSFVQRMMPRFVNAPLLSECQVAVILPGDFREDRDIRGCLPREHFSSVSGIDCVWRSIVSGRYPELFGSDHAVASYIKDAEMNDAVAYFSPEDAAGDRTAYVLDRGQLATWMDDIRIVIPFPAG